MNTPQAITLSNGAATITFQPFGEGFRPEWVRDGDTPVLRFKDHEWLNIGPLRIREGALLQQSDTSCCFGGEVRYAETTVAWSVTVSVPEDGGAGFTVRTSMTPRESIEVLDALTCYETPYVYDGDEDRMIVIAQQPVYRSRGNEVISDAGYMHPLWYYGRTGRAHLTYQSSTPMLAARIAAPDGSLASYVMLLGNWQICSVKDIIAQPTRGLRNDEADNLYPDPPLSLGAGKRGYKFLMGAVNWTASLVKDPNVLVEANTPLQQEVTLIATRQMPAEHWDGWLADGWERLCRAHFPDKGIMPAFEMLQGRDISWKAAAEWLAYNIAQPYGYDGLYKPGKGIVGYSASTRPRTGDHPTYWKLFCGQWAGPMAYLGHVWNDERILAAADRLEEDALELGSPLRHAEDVSTMSCTPHYLGLLRKGQIRGLSDHATEAIGQYLPRHSQVLLDPPPGGKRGDGGLQAWDALANLVAATLLPPEQYDASARALLARINGKLEHDFWAFNCSIEEDLVGGGQARPFGHGLAIAANMLAWQRYGDDMYLQAAQRFANLTLAMHFIVHNESPVFDLDTRGWAHGSTGGRDQLAQLPPWETAYALQQFAPLLDAGHGRPGIYDVLWLHRHSGLAQFPIARVLKRIYTPDMGITYRPMLELATERAFYLNLPYLSYENPWDQTMLAAYQGVEPLLLSLYYGDALCTAEDARILTLLPEAANYHPGVPEHFTVHCWNPTGAPIETRLHAVLAAKRGDSYRYQHAGGSGRVSPEQATSDLITMPPREVYKVEFTRE